MKYIVTYFAAALLSFGVVTHDTQAQETASKTDSSFHLDFTEQVSVWSFDSTIVEANTTLAWEATNWLTLDAQLPIYNNEAETGVGDISIAATIGILDGKCEFLGANKAHLDLVGAVSIPLDGAFSSDNAVFTIGADTGLSWGAWSLGIDGSYSFVDGATYVPQLGGFINSNWGNASATLAYAWNAFSVGAKLNETWSTDDGDILTLGPTLSWKIANNIELNGEVGFTVQNQGLNYGSSDFYVAGGLGISF